MTSYDLVKFSETFSYLNLSVSVHVEGQESGSGRSSLWVVVRFSIVPALGSPSLTVFFARMQPGGGGPGTMADLQVTWLIGDVGALEESFGRAQLGITRWKVEPGWHCVVAEVAGRACGMAHRKCRGAESRKSMI